LYSVVSKFHINIFQLFGQYAILLLDILHEQLRLAWLVLIESLLVFGICTQVLGDIAENSGMGAALS